MVQMFLLVILLLISVQPRRLVVPPQPGLTEQGEASCLFRSSEHLFGFASGSEGKFYVAKELSGVPPTATKERSHRNRSLPLWQVRLERLAYRWTFAGSYCAA